MTGARLILLHRHARPNRRRNYCALLVMTVSLVLLSGCSLPGSAKAVTERVWMLEDEADVAAADPSSCHVLRVSPARAAPGFSTTRMLYQRAPARLEHFAWQSWADTPAAMLTALIASRLERSEAVSAVIMGAADVPANVRLDLDAVRVLQLFESSGSYATIELSAQILTQPDRRLLAVKRFSYRLPTDSATPESGVAAANRATGKLLDELQAFVVASLNKLSCTE
ncbi:MAG: membrane integrity-associated transporter subunit PqiC [Halioglobus sp.]|nr:membrane integrity-associated transporter subunit PqiC [Halioglobus sp.]